MARCKVIIWNIERFGVFDATKKGLVIGSTRINGTLWAIAKIINTYAADVFIMQEFNAGGVAYLPILQAHLNAGMPGGVVWNFDYLPGSVKTGVAEAIGAVTGIGDLDYTVNGHMEGYAVFWKNTIPLVPFNDPVPSSWAKMSCGQDNVVANNGFISLISESHAYTEVDGADIPFQLDLTKPNIPAVFPKPNSESAGTYTTKSTRRAVSVTRRKKILYWENVRRPCVIFINTTAAISSQVVTINGINYNVIPVITHHGPNNGKSPIYSVDAASLAPFFYAGGAGNKPVIYGGDLNTSTRDDLRVTEADLTWFHTVSTTGAYSIAASTPTVKAGFRRTQTQYEYGWTSAVKGLITTGDNYELARDILYYRQLANVAAGAGVIDVLQDLTTLGTPLANALFATATAAAPNLLEQSLNDALLVPVPTPFHSGGLPYVVASNAAEVAKLSVPFTAAGPKNYTSLLSAAILYRCFITDHLPVAIEFDI